MKPEYRESRQPPIHLFLILICGLHVGCDELKPTNGDDVSDMPVDLLCAECQECEFSDDFLRYSPVEDQAPPPLFQDCSAIGYGEEILARFRDSCSQTMIDSILEEAELIQVAFLEQIQVSTLTTTAAFSGTEGRIDALIAAFDLLSGNFCTDWVEANCAVCAAYYEPVCGVDGITYGNVCVACIGHDVGFYEDGECID